MLTRAAWSMRLLSTPNKIDIECGLSRSLWPDKQLSAFGCYRRTSLLLCFHRISFKIYVRLFFMTAIAWTTMGILPATTPPPGAIPNFDNPISKAHTVYTISCICLSFATPLMIIRVYTRARIAKPLWWDDCEYYVAFFRISDPQHN